MTSEELEQHQAAHLALFRHPTDPEAPSEVLRPLIKELLFSCHYGVGPCGWRPSDEEIERYHQLDQVWLECLDAGARFEVLETREYVANAMADLRRRKRWH